MAIGQREIESILADTTKQVLGDIDWTDDIRPFTSQRV